MTRLGLALSGGGFRATLYHLGMIRFLRDAGLLSSVTDIASVSGGSILAAHLVVHWDRYNGDEQRFDEAAQEMIDFVRFDIRNRIIRRMPFQYPLRYLAKLTPIDAARITPNAILERYYRNLLYGDRRLYELPESPRLNILATNISNGGMSVFTRDGLYIQQRDEAGAFKHVEGTLASLAQVVGASSAFPGLFPPVRITAADLGVREGQFATEWFTDGGVYDNLGIRAFRWLQQQDISFDQILVSDAGKPFQVLSDAALGIVGQSMRATDILWDRVWQLERENFAEHQGFAFLPISETVSLQEDPTAIHPVIQAEVQSIRTDLDCFTGTEINALTQHGYGVARKVGRRLDLPGAKEVETPPWAPFPESAKAKLNGGEARTQTQQALELRKSSRRRTWSTLLSYRDWPSYVYVALAFLLLGVLPYQVYKLYHHSQVQATVLSAISSGDPDIRQILEMIDSDPTRDWVAEPIEDKAEPTEFDLSGIEILTFSRIIDLRRYRRLEPDPAKRGRIYVRDRRTVRFDESYRGDRVVTIRNRLRLENVEARQINSDIQGKISRIAPLRNPGNETANDQRAIFEVQYDLKKFPVGEPINLEVETLATYPELLTARAPFETLSKTDLLNVWMLFPEDRPYRTFSLVRYPADRSEPPEVMDARYKIDHPYGSLIGWSVVTPEVGMVYECRWTKD